MADFSLTTLFVVPTTQGALPEGSSTQDLTAGQVGILILGMMHKMFPKN